MIFNEIDINWKLLELVLILIALYFDPRITHTKVGKALINYFSGHHFSGTVLY